MKYCDIAWLVAPPHEIPADPGVANSGTPVVGCNHLVCDSCGAEVKYVDRRSTISNYPPIAADLQDLYQSSRPESSPLLDSTPLHTDSRTYFCQCNWYAVNLSARRRVTDIDPPWKCGGHVLDEARNIRVAEARKATDALIAATVPIFIPETGAKISLYWAENVSPAFATAAELRDSLLASYPDAAVSGVPIVRKNRENSAPAWGWARDLLLKRSDWWPALGVALQHASTDGGELAQTALVELLGHFMESVVLLPWTAPMAELWPERRTVNSAATGWGRPDYRLDAIIRDQKKLLVDVAGNKEAFLDGYGVGGKPISGPLTNEADLRKLLVESAHAGQSPGGYTGPWSWLADTMLLGDEWLRPAFVHIIDTLDHDDQAMVFALLDWFFEEQDLWKFAELLSSWHARPPSWWATAAETTPNGWKRNMRSAHWPNVKTLGDVATEVLRRAKWQVVTPPVLDLPQLYGTSIS